MDLNNEYERLLSYLESQEDSGTSSILKPKPKPIEAKPEVKIEELEEVKEVTRTVVHLDDVEPSVKKSVGFDVNKFESLMRAKLIDEHKRIQSYERPYISVSEICSCLRQCYYNRLKYSIDVERYYRFAWVSLIGYVGNSVHTFIQDLYDFTEKEKTIVSEKYKVKGRADGLKEGFLFEIKTVEPDKFQNKYIKEHYYQALIYAFILNTEYNYKIHTITIVYVLRNFKKIVPFDLPVNNSLAESFLKNSLILQSSIQKKTVPEPIGATGEQCNFCPYRKYCEKDESKVLRPFLEVKKAKEERKPKAEFLL